MLRMILGLVKSAVCVKDVCVKEDFLATSLLSAALIPLQIVQELVCDAVKAVESQNNWIWHR